MWPINFTLSQAHQYIKDSKVEICRGGRSTIAVEVITVETITVKAIAVEAIAVEAIAVHAWGGVNQQSLFETIAVEAITVETIAVEADHC